MSGFQASLVSDRHTDGQAQIYRTLNPVFYFCKIWFSNQVKDVFQWPIFQTATSTTNLLDTARLCTSRLCTACIPFFTFSKTNFPQIVLRICYLIHLITLLSKIFQNIRQKKGNCYQISNNYQHNFLQCNSFV